jgi:hypothetical protein
MTIRTSQQEVSAMPRILVRSLIASSGLLAILSQLTVVETATPLWTQQTSTQQASTQKSCDESEKLQKTVQQLTAEVERLRRRVDELEKDQRASVIQQQLEREEQRGESLQLHLIEITEKEEPLQSRLDQINQQLRPEEIDRILAGVGSVRPEQTRDELRRTLINERARILSHLEIMRQDRLRTQSSLATTDAAIQRLKRKLSEALRG